MPIAASIRPSTAASLPDRRTAFWPPPRPAPPLRRRRRWQPTPTPPRRSASSPTPTGRSACRRASYEVLRHEDTERPGTSPLLNEHRKGTFVCLGCDLPLFKSDWKFESGTGWPSFYTAIPGALGQEDRLQRSACRAPSTTAPSAWPPGPRLRRRPQAHRPALLQQRRGAEVRPGVGATPNRHPAAGAA